MPTPTKTPSKAGKAAPRQPASARASVRRMHLRELARAERERQDPSSGMAKARGRAAAVNGKQNWGETRDALVARHDPPTNWYRQAAKPRAR